MAENTVKDRYGRTYRVAKDGSFRRLDKVRIRRGSSVDIQLKALKAKKENQS